MDNIEKVRENRIRRMAQRQGLRVVKSRRRDTNAIDFGYYFIVDIEHNCVVAGCGNIGRAIFTLDDVEQWLEYPKKRNTKVGKKAR